ncbi:hypothetical protein J6590_026996 [Homalodisca vitripennis]|nr:hypothetical protein J6590_026996 [Homalodisca vitripennis]
MISPPDIFKSASNLHSLLVRSEVKMAYGGQSSSRNTCPGESESGARRTDRITNWPHKPGYEADTSYSLISNCLS